MDTRTTYVDFTAGVWLQRLGDHHWAQIAAANPNVDHVRDALAGVARPLATAHRLRAFLHLFQHCVHGGHDVLAVHHDRRVGAIAQGDVQHLRCFKVISPRDTPQTMHAWNAYTARSSVLLMCSPENIFARHCSSPACWANRSSACITSALIKFLL